MLGWFAISRPRWSDWESCSDWKESTCRKVSAAHSSVNFTRHNGC